MSDSVCKVINETTYWYDADGKLHNPNGPAVVSKDVSKFYIHGVLHYDILDVSETLSPAIVYADGSYAHFINGVLHNQLGKVAVYIKRYDLKIYAVNGTIKQMISSGSSPELDHIFNLLGNAKRADMHRLIDAIYFTKNVLLVN